MQHPHGEPVSLPTTSHQHFPSPMLTFTQITHRASSHKAISSPFMRTADGEERPFLPSVSPALYETPEQSRSLGLPAYGAAGFVLFRARDTGRRKKNAC